MRLRACQLAPLVVLFALCAAAEARSVSGDLLPWRAHSRGDVAGTTLYSQDPGAILKLRSLDAFAPQIRLPNGEVETLRLDRVPFRPEHFGVHVNGEYRGAADAPDLTLWEGHVEGESGPSDVRLSFSRHGSYGWIQTADELWHVSSYAPEGGSWDLADVRVFSEAQESRLRAAERRATLPDPGDWCQSDVVSAAMPPSPTPAPPATTLSASGTCTTVYECAVDIETDWQLYDGVFSQDLTATQVYMFCLLSAVSNRFEDEACTVLTFPYINFWTVSSDGWSTPDVLGSTIDMLYELQTEWADASLCSFLSPSPLGNRPSGATGRLAHFVSGAALGGGVAYRGVLSPSALCYQYGVSANIDGGVTGFPGPPTGSGSMNWDFYVIAHELGHNFNACHTHQTCNGGTPIDCCYTGSCCSGSGSGCSSQSCISTGTVMSYCHLCPGGLNNITTFFHPEIKDDMQAHAAAYLPTYTNVGTTICLGVENSTGAGALLLGTGSASIGNNDLMLTCSNLPTSGTGTTAMIVNSTGPAGVVVNPAAGGVASDGMLCIGTATNGASFGRHINDVYTGTAGTFTRAVDATDLPHPPAPPYSVTIAAGETWYFQVWYRDSGPAGRSNFSSAISVTFGP
ncbi:MAG: M12 family metallo-peptidase [Planctomycetota bacterium]|jgi:hypothetical protein